MEANLPIEGPIYQQPVQVSRRVVDYEIGEEENAENKTSLNTCIAITFS